MSSESKIKIGNVDVTFFADLNQHSENLTHLAICFDYRRGAAKQASELSNKLVNKLNGSEAFRNVREHILKQGIPAEECKISKGIGDNVNGDGGKFIAVTIPVGVDTSDTRFEQALREEIRKTIAELSAEYRDQQITARNVVETRDLSVIRQALLENPRCAGWAAEDIDGLAGSIHSRLIEDKLFRDIDRGRTQRRGR